MSTHTEKSPARFGTLLGLAPGNVPVYSSHYPSVDEAEYPDHHAYRSYVDGVFMGYKWQCVELARRWLYINRGYIFDDVAMAFDIFKLRSVKVVRDNTRLPLRAFRNGSKRHPEPGCLLIWKASGEFERTGHVAVVTAVEGDVIRCIEQNVDHVEWHHEKDYSRELKASLGTDGEYHIDCSFPDTHILGWVIQTDDDTHAEPIEEVDPRLFELCCREIDNQGQMQKPWLDNTQADEAAYINMMGGHKITGNPEDQYRFVCISETAHNELRIATNELHNMFMGATGVVLRHDHLLDRFDIPGELWPRLRDSWVTQSTKMITGRFDFSLSAQGIKAYEYNADSASCHLECGKIQLKWSEHVGCKDGWCPGEDLFDELVYVWRARQVEGILHILIDDEPEETYHALYMKSAMEAAGIRVKMIIGIDSFQRDALGHMVDAEGEPIRTVWKTWAWETAVDLLRNAGKDSSSKPGLAEVLFDPAITVYEPLWTLVTSNKAMLAVLWDMFPGSPWLLDTQFALTDKLKTSGYVEKPIAGRSGSNIRIVNADKAIVESTAGKFDKQLSVYQAFFPMPVTAGHHVQLSTFIVDGKYAATCARVDPSPIITSHSDILALRVMNDETISAAKP